MIRGQTPPPDLKLEPTADLHLIFCGERKILLAHSPSFFLFYVIYGNILFLLNICIHLNNEVELSFAIVIITLLLPAPSKSLVTVYSLQLIPSSYIKTKTIICILVKIYPKTHMN